MKDNKPEDQKTIKTIDELEDFIRISLQNIHMNNKHNEYIEKFYKFIGEILKRGLDNKEDELSYFFIIDSFIINNIYPSLVNSSFSKKRNSLQNFHMLASLLLTDDTIERNNKDTSKIIKECEKIENIFIYSPNLINGQHKDYRLPCSILSSSNKILLKICKVLSPKSNKPEENQEILNNSFLTAQLEIQKLDITKFEHFIRRDINKQPIVDEIEALSSAYDNIFTKSKSYAQIVANNHYLDFLMNDTITISKSTNKKIFKKFTTALIVGYTSKGIQLVSNKTKTMKELKHHQKILKLYPNNEQNIIFINKLILLIEEQKYQKFIPIKAIALEFNLPINKAQNLAKGFIDSFNRQTMKNHFDKLPIINLDTDV